MSTKSTHKHTPTTTVTTTSLNLNCQTDPPSKSTHKTVVCAEPDPWDFLVTLQGDSGKDQLDAPIAQ